MEYLQKMAFLSLSHTYMNKSTGILKVLNAMQYNTFIWWPYHYYFSPGRHALGSDTRPNLSVT